MVCRNGCGGRIGTVPLWPWVELPIGATQRVRCAEMGAPGACGRRHWGLRWGSKWGCETCERCAETGVADACGRCNWGLRWSSFWGHETCEGVQKR
eukprot:3225806-Pyramimonas_sp.AAC.1